MRGGLAAAALLCGLALSLVSRGWPANAQEAAGQSLLEREVKATYLYKLAPFISWPAPPALPAFTICVVGRDPFGGLLDRAVADQKAEGRPIVVRRLASADPGTECQIAYLGGSVRQSVADAEAAYRGHPVLTVTDRASDRGIVDLEYVAGHVRFRIDLHQAAASGLSVSSKLLALALGDPSRPG